MANCDDLLLMVFEMQETVDQQITTSEDEVKQQTRRLTYNDKLISDETLLSLSPDTLKSALSDDEYKEFMKKYPEHFIEKDVSTSESESTVSISEPESLASTETSESLSDTVHVKSESLEDTGKIPEVTDDDIEVANDIAEDNDTFDVTEMQPVKQSGFEWTTTMTVTTVVVILAILSIIGLITTIN